MEIISNGLLTEENIVAVQITDVKFLQIGAHVS